MPYIKKTERSKFKEALEAIRYINNAGELNYLLTCIYQTYIVIHGQKYQTFNDIMGAIEGSKLELYRRMISEYENTKINNKENGDVYKLIKEKKMK